MVWQLCQLWSTSVGPFRKSGISCMASLPPCPLLSSHPRCPPGPNRDAGPNGCTACVDCMFGTGETSDFLKDSSEHLQGMTNHPTPSGSNQYYCDLPGSRVRVGSSMGCHSGSSMRCLSLGAGLGRLRREIRVSWVRSLTWVALS